METADPGTPPQSGHETFRDFYRAEYRALVRFAYFEGAEWEGAAEDVAQEVMAQAFQHWSSLRNPRAWVRTAAKHLVIKVIIRWQREKELGRALNSARTHTYSSHGPDDPNETKKVLAMLATLPLAQREVFALTIDGYQPSEIAELLGKPPATIRSNLREARKRARSAFSDHWRQCANEEKEADI